MTRSDEIWTWCLKVIKRPPCDNILASNLPLRPASSARHRSMGICLLSLSSYPESRPCVWLQISTTWLKNKLKSMPNISVTYKPNVCFHQKFRNMYTCSLQTSLYFVLRNLLSYVPFVYYLSILFNVISYLIGVFPIYKHHCLHKFIFKDIPD